MKKLFIVSAALLLIMLFTSKTALAQFEINKNYLGPTIGLAFGASTISFGANYEYGIRLEEIANIGIGGVFRYWSYSDGYWSYTDIVIGAQTNYHFKFKNKKIDPWAGIILAFDFGSSNWSGPYSNSSNNSYGGMRISFNGGARYWISPTIALNGRFAFGTLGYGGIEIGVDFKF